MCNKLQKAPYIRINISCKIWVLGITFLVFFLDLIGLSCCLYRFENK